MTEIREELHARLQEIENLKEQIRVLRERNRTLREIKDSLLVALEKQAQICLQFTHGLQKEERHFQDILDGFLLRNI